MRRQFISRHHSAGGPAPARATRILSGAASLLLVTAASWVLAPTSAEARGVAALNLSPAHGGPATVFNASFRYAATGQCPGGQVDFAFDGQPVASSQLDQGSCTADASIQVPMGATPGTHRVRANLSGGPTVVSAAANFTVDGGGQPSSPPGQTSVPPPWQTSTKPGKPTSSFPTNFYNTITPTTPWTPPPFAPQVVGGGAAVCDTSGPHVGAAKDDALILPAYSAGGHPAPGGPTLVSEPLPGRLPVSSIGPAAMLPPQLGVAPYQSLELLEPYDAAVTPKLRLAAAAGSPFACIQVEAFGPAGSGYGYLVYALKGALVISAQDTDANGNPIVQAAAPTAPAGSPTPSQPGRTKPSATATPAAPKPVYERLVLGYTALSWEWQEASGATAPVHRGAGTIQPPPPGAPLSYGNLAVAFAGMVAATVALMFAYHSRRRELMRRARAAGSHL